MELDIESIARKCQQGNLEHFGLLFDAFHQKIYKFVYFRTHHKETAEDITSHIFTKALERITTFNPSKGSFTAWLYQIARNSIIDFYRSRKETENIDDAWDIADNTSLERDVDTRQQLEKVRSYLYTLPAQQRDIVLMRVWDDLSHKEIASILGTSEASVKMTFSRVLAKLHKESWAATICLMLIKDIYANFH